MPWYEAQADGCCVVMATDIYIIGTSASEMGAKLSDGMGPQGVSSSSLHPDEMCSVSHGGSPRHSAALAVSYF